MKSETIICDGCKQQIVNEYSHYPNDTRYWICKPVYTKPCSMMYAVATTIDEPKDYCPECFAKMEKAIQKEVSK